MKILPYLSKRKKENLLQLRINLIAFSKRRILIENINRLCKIFFASKMFIGVNIYGLTWRLVADLVSLKL